EGLVGGVLTRLDVHGGIELSARDIRYLDDTGLFEFQMQFDAGGGVLLPVGEGGYLPKFLGIGPHAGITRLLGTDESSQYDAEPDQLAYFEWPAATKDAVNELMQTNFPCRNVAISVSITCGRIAVSSQELPFSVLPQAAVVPLGVTARLLHRDSPHPASV